MGSSIVSCLGYAGHDTEAEGTHGHIVVQFLWSLTNLYSYKNSKTSGSKGRTLYTCGSEGSVLHLHATVSLHAVFS